jgi:hypothetical protein
VCVCVKKNKFIGLLVLKTSVRLYNLWYWVDLYLGFGLKNVQENQVQEAPFVDSFTDARTKCSNNEPRMQGRLLMSRRCLNNEFRMQAHSHMSGRIGETKSFRPLGCPHMSRRIVKMETFVRWVV